MTQRKAITIRLDEATLAALATEAESEFEMPGTVAARRLQAIYANGSVAPVALSLMASIEMRKKEAEAAMAEQRAAILRREYVRRDAALDVVARDYANIKSRVAQIPNQISGLTPEQESDGKKAVQDCFTDLTGESAATWDDLAKDAADEL